MFSHSLQSVEIENRTFLLLLPAKPAPAVANSVTCKAVFLRISGVGGQENS